METKSSSILSISGPYISDDCRKVVDFIKSMGLSGSITSNKSVMPNGEIENGCRVIFTEAPSRIRMKTEIWPNLQSKLDLSCAHYKIEGQFKGCIMDYLEGSKCATQSN